MTSTRLGAASAPVFGSLFLPVLFVLLFAITLIRPYLILTNPAQAPFGDFDIVHACALATVSGFGDRVYDEAWFGAFQAKAYGFDFDIGWTYPPLNCLLLAPFGLLDRGWALLLFSQASLFGFLLVLRRLTGAWFAMACLLLLPVMMMEVFYGQNGLLTGALIGLTCAGLIERKAWAGISLGAMIIKPHLAIGLALYVVVSRDWRSFWTAAAVVVGSIVVATLALGITIWPAFFAATGASTAKLSTDYFPLYRMVSAFTAARTLGAGTGFAWAAQLASAGLAIAAIVAAQRRLPVRQALGITAFASLLISPYAFDYDLAAAGVGLAILVPDLVRRGSKFELLAIYALYLAATAYGNFAKPPAGDPQPVSMAAFALVAVLALVWRVLNRDGQAEPVPA
jgi:hypothetical protein